MAQSPLEVTETAKTARRARALERLDRQVRRYQRRILIGALIAIVVGIAGLQLWPYGRDHTNPPVLQEPTWDSQQTRILAVRACYDCHSNETLWPWYTNIAPISMMIYQDVIEGRQVLNFSEWDAATWTREKTDRLIEVVNKRQMPLPYYLILHPESELSASENGQLVNGLIATFFHTTVENTGDAP
jgi:hypothetical protein